MVMFGILFMAMCLNSKEVKMRRQKVSKIIRDTQFYNQFDKETLVSWIHHKIKEWDELRLARLLAKIEPIQ